MNDYLEHHGILGQRWGVRRFQNSDGSLTSEGKKHYGSNSTSKTIKTDEEPRRKKLTPEQRAKVNKALKIGAATVAASLAAYGTYKFRDKYDKDWAFADMVDRGKETVRLNAKIQINKAKDIANKSGKEAYKGFKEGIPEGAGNAGKALGKVVAGGVVWMAGIKMADLATHGAITESIIPAYNGHVKKDNRVKAVNRKDD